MIYQDFWCIPEVYYLEYIEFLSQDIIDVTLKASWSMRKTLKTSPDIRNSYNGCEILSLIYYSL